MYFHHSKKNTIRRESKMDLSLLKDELENLQKNMECVASWLVREAQLVLMAAQNSLFHHCCHTDMYNNCSFIFAL